MGQRTPPRRRGKTGGGTKGGERGGANHRRRPPLPPREERAGAVPRADVRREEDEDGRGATGEAKDDGEDGRRMIASNADKFIDDVTNAVGLPKKNPPEGGDDRNTGTTEDAALLRTPALIPERARPKASAREDVASRNGARTCSFIAASTWSHVAGHSGVERTWRRPSRKRSM